LSSPRLPPTPPRPGDKILSRPELIARYGRPRAGRLVFTNGCFDLLHPGHVRYLDEARRLGSALVVGVNTDASVRGLKGQGRPLVPQEARALVLAGLAAVDAVTLFDQATPRDLIAALLPDVLVKGGDYRVEDVVGRAEVEAAGGEVRVLPFFAGYSTTDLVRRIADAQTHGAKGST
jgi:D-beta-D-heptose 7-phosphate kinase/D-beta-D-heptose 1-phosphate adenosyltransferase